jgi:hypothetical protein
MIPKGEFMGSNFGIITGPFLFIILILLFDHFRNRLAYCLAAFSKQFEHLKQQNICPPL